jgi:hypothetical protein
MWPSLGRADALVAPVDDYDLAAGGIGLTFRRFYDIWQTLLRQVTRRG